MGSVTLHTLTRVPGVKPALASMQIGAHELAADAVNAADANGGASLEVTLPAASVCIVEIAHGG